MQKNSSSHVVRIFEILNSYFRPDQPEKPENLLKLLIRAVISQNTNDSNSNRATQKLFSLFPTTEALMRASEYDILESIRIAGLASQKSRTIAAILHEFGENGSFESPEDLCRKSTDQALSLLTSIKGIGIKTASVFLAFGCGKDLCPVDTHVNRIAARMGWVDRKSSPDRTFRIMREIIPEKKAIVLHLMLIRLGREICTARNPKCAVCPVNEYCQYANRYEA